MCSSNIHIAAIPQHMSEEQPRYLFLHYRDKGKTKALEAGVKQALDTQAIIP